MKEKIRMYLSSFNWKSLGLLFLWAFIVNLIVETLGRFQANGVITGNIWGGLVAIFKDPYVILYGTLIIMFTISFGFFFRRRYFAMILISAVWLIFALSNFVLLSYRVTPFSAVDLRLIDTALAILTKYASKGTMIGAIVLIVLLIASFVVIALRAPVIKNRKISSAIFIVLLSGFLVFVTTLIGTGSGLLDTEFPNLADSYIDNGFAYCFSNSIFNTGISKPKTYSSEKVNEIVNPNNTKPANTNSPDSTDDPQFAAVKARIDNIIPNTTSPNVIFLQLESFFDITEVSKLKFSEDPVPFYRSLLAECPSGFLSMPCIGAGTANSEFEILTGMNLDSFGPGEYPYKTVLKNTTCESLAYNFHDQGYATHAIHNNRASFYDRHKIFSHLGFDDFTSYELMNIPEQTPNGWAKDKYLTGEIMKVLQSTTTRDFVYTISVQGHGKYPSTSLIDNPTIKLVDGATEQKWYGIEYYANQIKEMDDFLRELTETLSSYGEPVILVGYGDHLPGLGFTDEDLSSGTMKQTEYFVWANQPGLVNMQDEDIEAYQIGSRIMENLGFKNGVINDFHQTHRNEDHTAYVDDLEMLSYDILYGDKDVYGGKNPYEPTKLNFGVYPVEISNVQQDPSDENHIIITGNYFTKYSRIYLDDNYVETEFIDEHHVRGNISDIENGTTVAVQVCQSYKGSLILQRSNILSYQCHFHNASEYGVGGEDYNDNNNNYENPGDIGALIEEGEGETKQN